MELKRISDVIELPCHFCTIHWETPLNDTLHMDCCASTLHGLAAMTAHCSLPFQTGVTCSSIQCLARPWLDWRVGESAGGGQGLHLWPRSVTWPGLQGQIGGRRRQLSLIHKLLHCFGLHLLSGAGKYKTLLSAIVYVNIWFISPFLCRLDNTLSYPAILRVMWSSIVEVILTG